jgi:ribonuclease P protein component
MGEAGTSPLSDGTSLTFSVAQRLKHRRLIEPLFEQGNPSSHSVRSGVVRIVYRFVDPEFVPGSFQIGVAVGRSRGSAPRRNRVKRILREAIRHDQPRLERIANREGQPLTAMVLFQGNKASSARIRSDFEQAMQRLEQRSNSAPC